MDIVFSNDLQKVRELVGKGYCPVECSVGIKSIVDALNMDHHGELSGLEGVAIRAYRDHFSARKADPRFVVSSSADADACFAIASLAGVLPHPSRKEEFSKAPPAVQTSNTRDISAIAELINRIDVDPIGVRLEESDEGAMLLLWNQMSSNIPDVISFYSGIDRWRKLLGGRTLHCLLAAAKEDEAGRVKIARSADQQRISEFVGFVQSSAWGFDVWYSELAPVICAYVVSSRGGKMTIGAKDLETAEKLFNAGGLKNVFPKLQPNGWGGRETVGGSPRDADISKEYALSIAREVASMVSK